MSEPNSEEQAARLDGALQESQAQERAEQEHDLRRQQQTDDEIVQRLSREIRPE
jgi:hypothetical protein